MSLDLLYDYTLNFLGFSTNFCNEKNVGNFYLFKNLSRSIFLACAKCTSSSNHFFSTVKKASPHKDIYT